MSHEQSLARTIFNDLQPQYARYKAFIKAHKANASMLSSSCTTETSSSSDALFQLFDDLYFRGVYPLYDQLGDPVPFLDLEVLLCVVEEQNFNRASVI